MAGSFIVRHTTGATVYAVIRRRSDGQAFDGTGPAFEAYDTASLGDYDIAMTEQGTASGIYAVANPLGTDFGGDYRVDYYVRAGGSPAEGDTWLGFENFSWHQTNGAYQTSGNANVTYWHDTEVLNDGTDGVPRVDVIRWQDDLVADNSDGIPTVNVVQVSGSSAAADFLEAALLNTGTLPVLGLAGLQVVATGNNHAVSLIGDGSGHGLQIIAGASANGIDVAGGSSSGTGVKIAANGGGSGLTVDSVGSNPGIQVNSTSSAILLNATTAGIAIAASGAGIEIDSTGNGIDINSTGGHGVIIASGSNGHGINIAGNGTGHGITIAAGSTGTGVVISGGATTGHGVHITTTDGHGIFADATGTDTNGMRLDGGTTGAGLKVLGGTEGLTLGVGTIIELEGPPLIEDTAGQTIPVYLVDTGLSFDSVTLSKDGAAFSAPSVTTVTEIADGWYYLSPDATDVNTAGAIIYNINEAGGDNRTWFVRTAVLPPVQADVVEWLGAAVATPTTAGVPEVDVTHWIGTAAATPTTAGVPEVDVTHWIGTAVTLSGGLPEVAGTVAGTVDANVVEWLGSAVATPTTAGVPEVDVTFWLGGAVATPTTTGVPEVDVTHWIGTAAATPTTAGVPEVDVTFWRGGAVPATTQTGVPEVDVTHWIGTAVTLDGGLPEVSAGLTGTIDANVIEWNGSAVATPTVAGVPEVDATHWRGTAVGDPTVEGVPLVEVSSYATGQAPLQPTVAGRTLDVSAGGEAGVDWANVGSPTTTVTLSGTTVKTATDVETDTADIQTRLPAALVSGRMDSSVGAMASNVITAAAIASDAIDADALAAGAANEIADALLDRANGIESGYTLRQSTQLILAASCGKVSGAATTTITIRSADDSADRVVATVDADGNRTATVLTPS